MKRALSVVMIVILLMSILSVSTLAASGSSIEPSTDLEAVENIEYFADGSYLITTIEAVDGISPMSTSTKTGSKLYRYFNSKDVEQWTVTIIGTFSYNGSSATCTSSKISYSVSNSKWKFKEATATKSGNKAIGNFTVKYYFTGIPINTIEHTLTLSCSATGVLS